MLRTATPGGTVKLDANTTYWIVLDAHLDADLAWCFNSTGAVGNAGRSGNPPGVWNWEPTDQEFGMLVNARLFPEPAIAGFIAALPLIWRQRLRLD